MKTLHEALTEYSKSDAYAFHMPGHKGIDCDAIDITEIDGFDDLHEPQEIILWEMNRIASLYHVKKSYILVGGSTLGNLVSVFATCSNTGDLIIDRGCHKSVYNASVVARANLSYINQFDLQSVKQTVSRTTNAKAIVITAPTYEGYMPDVSSIADIAHSAGMALIVDAAHGAHLGFDVNFPKSPVEMGADLVVMSLHKTLPALTMTAVLHVCSDRLDTEIIEKAIDIFETSSPSYLLMDSVSKCMTTIEMQPDIFKDYFERLQRFYSWCARLKNIKVDMTPSPSKDPGKICILSSDSAKMYQELVGKYHLQPEMKTSECVLMMTSVSDTDEGFSKLAKALEEMDSSGKYSTRLEELQVSALSAIEIPKASLPLYEAVQLGTSQVRLSESINGVCGSFIIQYPPGSPILVPGEIISQETVDSIERLKNKGIKITGLNKDSDGFTTISVVK